MSGQGLSNIYSFLRKSKNMPATEYTKEIDMSVNRRAISEHAQMSKMQCIFEHTRKSKIFDESSIFDKSGNLPELISKYRKMDPACKEAFRIFKIVYAKFARNLALDCMAFGGVYIAGGIAPKNRGIFDKEFISNFERNYAHADILKKIPVYLIINYNVGLLGAGFAGAKFLK